MGGRDERRARAQSRLAVARRILDDLELLERWKVFGDPVIVGSVGLELVVRPDIDMEIFADVPSVRDGFTVVADVTELPHVSGARYHDFRHRSERGLYWKLLYDADTGTGTGTDAGKTWTIDMWVFPRDYDGPSGSSMAAAIRAALTDDSRDTILAIKEEAAAVGQRAHGHWLYRAVLNEGIRSYADYLAWMGDRDVWERVSWRPIQS